MEAPPADAAAASLLHRTLKNFFRTILLSGAAQTLGLMRLEPHQL